MVIKNISCIVLFVVLMGSCNKSTSGDSSEEVVTEDTFNKGVNLWVYNHYDCGRYLTWINGEPVCSSIVLGAPWYGSPLRKGSNEIKIEVETLFKEDEDMSSKVLHLFCSDNKEEIWKREMILDIKDWKEEITFAFDLEEVPSQRSLENYQQLTQEDEGAVNEMYAKYMKVLARPNRNDFEKEFEPMKGASCYIETPLNSRFKLESIPSSEVEVVIGSKLALIRRTSSSVIANDATYLFVIRDLQKPADVNVEYLKEYLVLSKNSVGKWVIWTGLNWSAIEEQ